jgi:hypothetical protein
MDMAYTLRLPPIHKECIQINLCQASSCLHPCTYDTLSCPYPCTYDTVVRKNLMRYICYHHFVNTVTFRVSALKGPSPGSAGAFYEQGQQNVSVLPEDGPLRADTRNVTV